jgi:hypothetical protein
VVNPFDAARAAFRGRVSGDPTGAPDWVREIATVGSGDGWFDPDGVVWRVHGDLSTLVGGVAALLGQGAHPLALAGVQRHSAYREDPWKRLAGTARWLVVSTFGSAQLAERESARVRGMHRRVKGTLDDGRSYSAGDPDLLRWVHLAFTDAFLAAQTAVGRDMSRFGPRWGDDYVREWARTADHPHRAGRGDPRLPTGARAGARRPAGVPAGPARVVGARAAGLRRVLRRRGPAGLPHHRAAGPGARARVPVAAGPRSAAGHRGPAPRAQPRPGLAQPERGGGEMAPGHGPRSRLGDLPGELIIVSCR